MRIYSYLIILCVTIQTCLGQTDKYTDENRPYKFGFNIEGYQHRQEEKDEKGLIKGEYGFITADGYYRVTVYATDENGDFRIISMKNYYVGFPPEDPQTTPQPPTQFGARIQPSGTPQVNPLSATQENDSPRRKDILELTGLTACSNCLIPTTKKPEVGARFGGGKGGNPGFGARTGQGFGGGSGGDVPVFGARTRGGTTGFNEQNRGRGSDGGFVGTSGGRGGEIGFGDSPERRGSDGRFGETPAGRSGNEEFGGAPGRRGGEGGFGGPPGGRGPPPGGRGSARFLGSDRGQFRKNSPNIVTDRVGNGRPEVGTVRDGLPRGISVDDIKALLYTFNYTVGFHGHHEDGYRNGDKEGDYFFDGRDGVERRVEYIANEFGYQPNITFVDLPENDVKRPKEETEKEYGLKGYEFKWFYRK